MIENFLYPLTNRATGFVWSRLPVDSYFVPRELPDYAEAVRLGLSLENETTDFFVVGVLNALVGSPWVAEEAGNLDDLFMLVHYSYPPDGWLGGDLKAGSEGPAALAFKPDTWPVSLDWSMSYLNSQQAVLQNGAVTEVVQAVVNPSGRLRVGWPARLQARGVVDLNDSWQEGASVFFTHHPAAYPYRAAAEALGGSRDTNQLLLRTGLATGWHAARSDMERIALLALGLIRTYHKE